MVTKIETAFWTIGFFIVLVGIGLFTLDAVEPVDYVHTVSEESYSFSSPSQTYTVEHGAVVVDNTADVVEYDYELELGYLLMKAQDVDSVSELNELEERMYDILEDYDEVEMEYFYEQMDNARERVEN